MQIRFQGLDGRLSERPPWSLRQRVLERDRRTNRGRADRAGSEATLRQLVLRALCDAGLDSRLRHIRRRQPVILAYHGFLADDVNPSLTDERDHVEVRAFEAQMAYLARYHNVISLESLVAARTTRVPLPDNPVVITVDDGYRSTYQLAYPILRRHGLPVTVFLVGSFVDGQGPLWNDRVDWAFANTRREQVVIGIKGQSSCFDLASDWERAAAASIVRSQLKGIAREPRDRVIEKVEAELCCSLTGEVVMPAHLRPLDWNDVRTMVSGGGVTIGNHTYAHPILSCCDATCQKEEIEHAGRLIETHTGHACRVFAYPNGQRADYDCTTRGVLTELGYACAVTMVPGYAMEEDGPFDLPRIAVHRGCTLEEFIALLYGGLRSFPRTFAGSFSGGRLRAHRDSAARIARVGGSGGRSRPASPKGIVMSTLEFARERPARARDILGLFERGQDPSLNPAVYRWKHLENPHGVAVTWTARERRSGRLVGAVSLMPRLRRFNGELHMGGQLVDAVVEPGFRRRGVFTRILNKMIAEHADEGFEFLYLLPTANAMSRGAFRGLPFFVHVATLRRYRRFWTGRTFARRILGSDLLARGLDPLLRWGFEARDRLDVDPIETQLAAWSDDDDDGFVQDHDWFVWRTRAPGCQFMPLSWAGGGALVRVDGSTAMLYALRLGRRGPRALRALLDRCERERLDALYCDAHLDAEVEALLVKAGFVAHSHGGDHYIFGTHHPALRSGYEPTRTTFMRADLDVP